VLLLANLDQDDPDDQRSAQQAEEGKSRAPVQVSGGGIPFIAAARSDAGPTAQRIQAGEKADEGQKANNPADERSKRLADECCSRL
jgi:hypothetical protein